MSTIRFKSDESIERQTRTRRRRRNEDSKPVTMNAAIPNRQPIPWNIQKVKGPVVYTGSNKAWILDTGIMMNHPDLNVDRVNAFNVFTGTSAANDDK